MYITFRRTVKSKTCAGTARGTMCHPTWYVVPDIRWEPSIKDVRKGEGVCQKRTFADVGVGFVKSGVWGNADGRKILEIFHKI